MSFIDSIQPCFQHGRVVITTGIVDLVKNHNLNVLHYFRRHLRGDWGNIPAYHGLMNEAALRKKAQLFSAYSINPALKILIITELDRGVTTLLLPEELESYHTDLAN